jgi:hypothetical protein
MPPFLVIDHDGPTRATYAALRRRDFGITFSSHSPRGATPYDAVVADTCMRDAIKISKIRDLVHCQPAAHLIAIASNGAVAPVQDAPNFRALAGRLVAR